MLMPRIHNKLHDTYPVVAHQPYMETEKSPYWQRLVEAKDEVQFQKPQDTTIVTWNSKKDKGLLEQQLDALNIPYLCLGKGLKWKTNRLKISTLLEVIDTIDTKYILGMDCYDVVVTGSMDNFPELLEKKQAKMVYNAATWLYPKSQKHGLIERELCRHQPFQYLNGGLFFGERLYVKEFFSELPDDENYPTSEQYLLKLGYHQKFPDVQLDWNCEMFQIVHLPKMTKDKIENYVELID